MNSFTLRLFFLLFIHLTHSLRLSHHILFLLLHPASLPSELADDALLHTRVCLDVGCVFELNILYSTEGQSGTALYSAVRRVVCCTLYLGSCVTYSGYRVVCI